MGVPVVRVQGVSKTYYRDQTPVPVLEGIDLDVQEGQFVALMGPSGSGKTTVLRAIAALEPWARPARTPASHRKAGSAQACCGS